ncbi:restriction endonuclease subunit S [Vibrio vulnificus]
MAGRYKAYPEYKSTDEVWLGNVPSHWRDLKINRLTIVKRGASPRPIDDPKYFDEAGEYSWVRIADVTASDTYLENTPQRLSPLGASLSVKLEPNELFLSIAGTVGKPCINKIKACIHDGFVYFPEYKENTKFLFYIFAAGEAYKGLGKFGTQLNLNTETVGGIKIGIPCIEEQHKIVNFLDHETAKIDTLIAKQEKLIELLKEKRQAVISHAVTKGLNPDAPMKDSGVEWLGEVPEHWTVGRVKNLAKLISKGTTPSTIGGDFIDEGIRFLKGENIGKSLFVNPSPTFYISEEVDAQLSRSRLQENDVLVIIAGATTGKASILTKELLPANTNQAVSFIRPKKAIYSKLITLWLSTEYAQRIIWMGAVQAAQPNLSMENLGNLPIVLPDEVEIAPLLNEIDKKVEQFDALIIKANSAIELMKERKTALISAAVTGKIDVRDWESK